MLSTLLAVALASSAQTEQSQGGSPAAPVEVAPVALPIEQQAAIRCSAAFALVAGFQKTGDPRGESYPPLEERGREFFVRAIARLMDDTGRSREDLARRVELAADRLRMNDTLGATMPACLLALDASGL